MSETKEHIIEIAIQLFLQKSYKEITMKDLVEKTGMSKGAFYHYFESKEQLFLELIERYIYSVMQIDFNEFSSNSLYEFYHDYLEDQYAKALSMLKKFFNKESTFIVNYFYLLFDAIKISPDFIVKFKEVDDREIKAWEKIINTAKEKKEIMSQMNNNQIAKCFHYIEQGASMGLVMEGRMLDWKDEVTGLWDAFYKELKN